MNNTLDLSAAECAIIRSWHEHALADTLHFGGADLAFPTEQILLNKLKHHLGGPLTFSSPELYCIADWMDRAIGGKFGSDRFLFGNEETVYRKITAEVNTGQA